MRNSLLFDDLWTAATVASALRAGIPFFEAMTAAVYVDYADAHVARGCRVSKEDWGCRRTAQAGMSHGLCIRAVRQIVSTLGIKYERWSH